MTASSAPILIGESRVMRNLRALIATAAAVPLPVLIEGPTGAGKELVAGALHAQSGRRGRMVAINVCAVCDTMFEDALFGHVRGAFTGAVRDRLGFMREADAGTLFLDEIGGLTLPLQATLLRALETKQVRPVGGHHDVRADTRVIAATNEPMHALLAADRFRRDLAHRLMGVVIRVPSLRERAEDIDPLARHFLGQAGHPFARIAAGALRRLQAYPWPGNVRELRQVIEWSDALSGGCLSEQVIDQALAERGGFGAGDAACYLDRDELRDLLARHRWNTDSAARELGIHRATVYRRMKRLHLSPPRSAGRVPATNQQASG